jgi:hypothetical protein
MATETRKSATELLDEVLRLQPDFVSEDVAKAAEGVTRNFKDNIPGLTNEQLTEIFVTFGALMGTLSERPEVLLGVIDAYSVLRNGENIMYAAAIQVKNAK